MSASHENSRREMNVREEKKLEPGEVSWNEREERVAEHPPTGAPKNGSLLKDLADEALSNGRPVLVIPLDAADPQTDQPDDEYGEQPHDLRLPKNTTVIFAGMEGFPATPSGVRGQSLKAVEKHGDLGAEASERTCLPADASRTRGARIVDPEAAGAILRSPLDAAGEMFTRHSVIFGRTDRGKGAGEGSRQT